MTRRGTGRTTPKVAFVLSGGGSLGAIQVGMLRALVAQEICPDLIVGTSVGAINGAFMACHGVTPATVDRLAGLWLSIRRGQVFPVEPLTGLLGFLGARASFVPAGALRRLLTRHLDCERLEDVAIPLHVIACDLLSGREVRLSRGPLVAAVLASAAIPGVLPPVEWDGRLLIDGGVINNTPISHALRLGATEIYALPTGGPCELSAPPRGVLGMLLHANALMVAQRFAGETAACRRRAELTILPPPCPSPVHPLDFAHSAALMTRAEADARAFLEARTAPVVPSPIRVAASGR